LLTILKEIYVDLVGSMGDSSYIKVS